MISEARKRANKRWDKENLEQINLSVPKGTKDLWKEAAKERGLSLSGFIQAAVNEKMGQRNPLDG